ncbi:UpxY family transcription antiterminator [Dysgonomonas sp. Marseille-P4677]|uniref:UpxY family transcription antiterminator n=1 Tax=Dysgonomonas sp. Marseille-P4677 TaxID=2364790 RepID=UPI0019135F03|nr:UpxY family transcription antiterminator [Dysgonomonas sp. Marseille-P4677]MBK5721488.1 UpxY family transcription antiterminator [Dysgonomonas sp. Marseille-P4677]
MLYYKSNVWFAARVRHNQEKSIKRKLEQLGVENYIPFRKEIRKRKDRTVEVWAPVIPNIVFIYTDFYTGMSIANDYGISITYLKSIDGKGLLVVPQKQMDSFKLICESNVDYTLSETFEKGDHVLVVDGCLKGIEGELIRADKKNCRMLVKLDGIATFKLVVDADMLSKTAN